VRRLPLVLLLIIGASCSNDPGSGIETSDANLRPDIQLRDSEQADASDQDVAGDSDASDAADGDEDLPTDASDAPDAPDVGDTPDADADADADGDGDLDGEPDADLVEETSSPKHPIAVAGDDVAGEVGVPLEFDGRASFDPDGTIEGWRWSFGDGGSQEDARVFYTYRDPGEYVVTLTVTDDDGLTDRDTLRAVIAAPNAGPTAVIRVPDTIVRGETIEIDGGDSSDDDGEIISWLWDVGVDGVDPIAGETIEYAWSAFGEHSLSLTVEDDDGDTDSAEIDVDVWVPPVAFIDGPTVGTVGVPVSFDGTGSSDEDGSVVEWSWEFPAPTATSAGTLPSHTFDTEGEHDVFLTVTDNDGLTHTDDHKVFIEGPPNSCPTAVITGPTPEGLQPTGTVLNFSSSSSTDDGTITGYVWDWGDGSEATVTATTLVDHTYADNGSYTVTLTAQDDEFCTYDGEDEATHSARTTVTVDVTNRPPTAVLEVEATTIEVDTSILLDGTSSSDVDGTIDHHRLEIVGGTAWDGFSSRTVSFSTVGNRVARLTVTDDDGATDTDEVTITVTDGSGGGGCGSAGDYNGSWLLSEAVVQSCAFDIIMINFNTIDVSHSVPAAAAGSVSLETNNAPGLVVDRPGVMSGAFSTPTVLSAQNVISGTPSETFAIGMTFTSATTADVSINFALAGVFDCVDMTPNLTATCVPD